MRLKNQDATATDGSSETGARIALPLALQGRCLVGSIVECGLRTSYWLSSLFLVFVFAGCSPDPVVVGKQGESVDNLMEIQSAYWQFAEEKRKPPANKEDIMPLIPADRQATIFNSPRDGKPYKIYWGASVEETNFENPTIIVHEQDGADGKRYVLSTVGVMVIEDDEFSTASFPASSR